MGIHLFLHSLHFLKILNENLACSLMIYRASRLAFLNPRIWKNYLMHYMQISLRPKACLMSDAYSYYNLYKILLTYVTFVTLDVFLPKILAFDKIWIHMHYQNMYYKCICSDKRFYTIVLLISSSLSLSVSWSISLTLTSFLSTSMFCGTGV